MPSARVGPLDRTLGAAAGRRLGRPGQHRDPAVAEAVEVAERVLDAAVVVEHDLADGRHPGQRVADGDHGHALRDRRPVAARRPDRRHDDAVDALVDEPAGQLQLEARRAVGVGDQRVAVGGAQLPLHGAGHLLREEVGQAADQQRDHAGGAAAEGARDRIGLVAHLGRGLLHARLRLGRHLDAAQRVGDGGGRQAGLRGELADRRALRGAAWHGSDRVVRLAARGGGQLTTGGKQA